MLSIICELANLEQLQLMIEGDEDDTECMINMRTKLEEKRKNA